MQIIIRLDDIAPGMNFDKFNRMRAILEKYNIKPIIGVVPECRDENLGAFVQNDFWSLIRSLAEKGWVIAQHGTYHVYETESAGLLGINPFSEFAGLTYEAQLERLKRGKEILQENGIFTDVFMAPGHTYDDNTIMALKRLEFKAITDGLYKRPYIYNEILCVPCRMSEIRRVKGFDTLCFHTNLMEETDFDALDAFIKLNVDNIIPFEIKGLKKQAILWDKGICRYEKRVLAARKRRNAIANSKRLAWYLSYTNHKNHKIKFFKRLFFLPLIFLNKERK